MPFRGEHVARLNEPGKYEKLVRVNREKGVSFLIGTLPDGTTERQSIRFDSDRFTVSTAKEWMREHDLDPSLVEAAKKEERADSEDEDCPEEFRFDSGTASKFRVEPGTGFGHFDHASLSTVGVYKYKRADGTIRREFRPPTEVQSKRFIKSLQNCVVTREHPYPRGTAVNRKNYKRFAIGSTGTDAHASGYRIDSSLVIRDEKSLTEIAERLDSGLPVGCSVGYKCKTRKQSGVWQGPNGAETYDYVQFGHVANHVAITSRPRGGLDKQHGTVLHLDSLEAEQLETEEKPTMENVEIDIGGLKISVLAAHAPLLQDTLSKLDSKGAESAKTIGTLEAKVSELTEANEKLTTDSEEKPNLGELLAARQKLTGDALKIVKQETLDKVDSAADDYDAQLIGACLDAKGVKIPEHLEGDARGYYMQARFDSLVENAGDDAHKKLSSIVAGGVRSHTSNRTDSDASDIQERFRKAQEARDNFDFGASA